MDEMREKNEQGVLGGGNDNADQSRQECLGGEQSCKTVVVTSIFRKELNAAVAMKMEAWIENFQKSRRYMEYFAERGIHYIFEMRKAVGEKETVAFRVEARTPGANGLYAEAKVQQLINFPWQSHTGGETISQVRGMLLDKGVSEDDAAAFYVERNPDDSVGVISEETAVWLRDTFGIAPWYGGLNFPYSIDFYGQHGINDRQQGRIVSGFSGCENSQEDLLYNVDLTDTVLGTFASALASSVVRLDLAELRKDPITETPIHWLGFTDVVTPAK